MFGHAALYAGIAATVFPGTQTGVTANSPSIAEAMPVVDDRHSVTDVLTQKCYRCSDCALSVTSDL